MSDYWEEQQQRVEQQRADFIRSSIETFRRDLGHNPTITVIYEPGHQPYAAFINRTAYSKLSRSQRRRLLDAAVKGCEHAWGTRSTRSARRQLQRQLSLT